MKKKEVEDILGGKGAWDNVDKTQGKFGRAFRSRHAESDFGVSMVSRVY
jgi:hypothetical protein